MKSLSTNLLFTGLTAGVMLLVACTPADKRSFDRVERHLLNRTAVRLNLPLYWIADSDHNDTVEPQEVITLLFYDSEPRWVEDGSFTAAFAEAYEKIVAAAEAPIPDGLAPAEQERRTLVREDLDHGIATLVFSDLSRLPAHQQSFVDHMLEVSKLVDAVYAEMNGSAALGHLVAADDSESLSLFRRNRGPACVAPRTYRNPACSAIAGAPQPIFGVYPHGLQQHEDFCAVLQADRDAVALCDPFTVVREAGDELVAVPLTDAYGAHTQAIAAELEAAAEALAADDSEAALREYLKAAAQAFVDNHWEPADEAWAAMNGRNSKWYLRVAPDEVYWEPCALKAGIHMTFAAINTDSLTWQDRLNPVRQEMENRVADLIGPPYTERTVSFKLPDFIDIVLNAGDDRDPLGATIGQSLPNWGPVANEGRGRTVAMSNLYTDPDSLEIKRAQASSLLTADTLAAFTSDPTPSLFNTILHEASHNLGPSHEYEVDGKVDTEIFGGGMASVMEEMKAQTAALWFVDFLRQQNVISEELAHQTYVDGIVWAFGHIARGMYTAAGNRKAYSQLAAMQIGILLESGALTFDEDALAANGIDQGAFSLDFTTIAAAVNGMMEEVGTIKAQGDRAEAERLAALYVDGDSVPQKLIAERILRQPKASFVYAVAR